MPSLRLMTTARQGRAHGYARISALARRGVCVARSRPVMQRGADSGRHAAVAPAYASHLYNACSFSHRTPSLVNYGLLRRLPSLPEYADVPLPSVEVIADGVHVHATALQLLLDAHDRIACISDAILAAAAHSSSGGEQEQQEGRVVKYGDRALQSHAHGGVYLAGTNTLAGSCLTLDVAVRRLINEHSIEPARAVAFVTCVPAAVANLPHVGHVRVGARANLVAWSRDWHVQRTYVGGNCVYDAAAEVAVAGPAAQ